MKKNGRLRTTILAIFFLSFLLSLANVIYSQNYQEHLKKGKWYIENCRYKEKSALYELKKAYKLAPNNYEVIFWLGRAYYENRMFEEAKEMFEEAVKIKPKDVDANAWLGYTYGRIGKDIIKRSLYMIKSANQIKKVLDLDPNFADAYYGLAIGCTYLGWFEKPTGIFRTLVKIFIKDEAMVDKFSAESLYFEAIKLNPKNAWYYTQLGWLYLKQKRISEAKKMFEKGVNLAAKDIKCGLKDAYLPRAIALYYEEAEMWDLALKYAKIALQWNPKDLWLSPHFSIKRIINRLYQEKKQNKLLMKDIANEL